MSPSTPEQSKFGNTELTDAHVEIAQLGLDWMLATPQERNEVAVRCARARDAAIESGRVSVFEEIEDRLNGIRS